MFPKHLNHSARQSYFSALDMFNKSAIAKSSYNIHVNQEFITRQRRLLTEAINIQAITITSPKVKPSDISQLSWGFEPLMSGFTYTRSSKLTTMLLCPRMEHMTSRTTCMMLVRFMGLRRT